MNNEKNNFLTVSWLSGLLSAEIFISTGEWGVQMPPLTSENSHFLRSGPQEATLVMLSLFSNIFFFSFTPPKIKIFFTPAPCPSDLYPLSIFHQKLSYHCPPDWAPVAPSPMSYPTSEYSQYHLRCCYCSCHQFRCIYCRHLKTPSYRPVWEIKLQMYCF